MPLQARRAAAGLSLREIAAYSGLNRGDVSRIERGRLIPTEDQLARYMTVLADYETLSSRRGQAAFLTDEERAARAKARQAVARAIRTGELVRGPCEACDAEPAAAHHRYGYAEPLRVVWLCPKHHGIEHYDMLYERRMAATEERQAARWERSKELDAKHRPALRVEVVPPDEEAQR